MSIPFVKTVCTAMENIAPLRLAEKWDNVSVSLSAYMCCSLYLIRFLTRSSLTPSVVEECISLEAPVIVSYHPPVFRSLQSLTLSNPLQASLLRCAADGISIFSPHSALDSVWGGVNDWLAKGLGKGRSLDVNGKSEGAEGRLLVDMVKKHLGLLQVQVAYPSSSGNVRTVAICAGSGGSMLVGRDADLYLTGEMSHHEVLASVAAGKHVILCGHTNTERGFLPVLAERLRKEIQVDDLEVIVSQKDAASVGLCLR
ncbi:GTP cyclohydrolase 1 type 2/Nif3 [Armillaria luteobubalina]|uniref:GTP cyclohydrolase 1 type 2/Nif3 n=1 Tax=Armillaria luteobubalina TaxID=153913 RepID=A0AA39PZN8_9AGAR|nr:GTP cyclohydrolase 1 type 2/Nif3 [Armillaria luteobubalina]